LAQFVLSAANIRRYAEIVRDKSILRKLTSAVDKIGVSVFESNGKSVEDVLADAEREVLSISNSVNQVEIRTLDENTDRFIDRLQHLADNPDKRPGVKSGYTDLDTTGGLQAGELVVIAGRPSMGKTALAMNIAEHAAFQQQLGLQSTRESLAKQQRIKTTPANQEVRLISASSRTRASSLRSSCAANLA
jgi:replicative DNA helicase